MSSSWRVWGIHQWPIRRQFFCLRFFSPLLLPHARRHKSLPCENHPNCHRGPNREGVGQMELETHYRGYFHDCFNCVYLDWLNHFNFKMTFCWEYQAVIQTSLALSVFICEVSGFGFMVCFICTFLLTYFYFLTIYAKADRFKSIHTFLFILYQFYFFYSTIASQTEYFLEIILYLCFFLFFFKVHHMCNRHSIQGIFQLLKVYFLTKANYQFSLSALASSLHVYVGSVEPVNRFPRHSLQSSSGRS